MNANPYEPLPIQSNAGSRTVAGHKARLLEIAKAQRFLCKVILGAIVLTIGMLFVPVGLPVALVVAMQLVLSTLQAIAVFRMGKSVFQKTTTGVAFLLLALIPCIGLIALLTINGMSTNELTRAGYRVGLLGANLRQFDSDQPPPKMRL